MRWSHSMVFGICFIRVMLLSEVASSVWLDVGSSNGGVQTYLEVYVARSCHLAELHSRFQDYQQRIVLVSTSVEAKIKSITVQLP